jgi:penicillin-binding protein 1A
MAADDRRGVARPGGIRRWPWLRGMLLSAGLLTLFAVTLLAAGTLWAFMILPRSLPSVTALEKLEPLRGTKIYDENDDLVTELHVERRIFVPLRQVPRSLRDAVIATEDRRFYYHWGVDPIGIGRAVVQNYRQGRIVEGGSTITQQLAKVLFLTPDRSLERKLKEAVLALEIERRYSKDRILEMYLNQVYFGQGAYGVEAAARTYFGKSVSEVTVREAALLAGLPRAPSAYAPFENPKAARQRRQIVLRQMVEHGVLKEAEALKLAASDLGLIPPERRRTTGQYFLDHVQQTLEAKYGADMVFKGGLNVYTTLNPSMQLAAEQSLRDGLTTLEGRSARARPGEHPEGAIVTIEPHTGYVRALVGGYDFFRSEFNRAVQARRQPGSAFKTFVYAAALEAGFTPATRIDDAPVSYAVGPGGTAWKPENYDRRFRGPTTLQQSIEESVNVVTVKLQERVGVNRTIRVARRFGIQSPLSANLSLALGTSDVSLLELTSAYGALANQGVWVAPTVIRQVFDAGGKLLEENVPQGREAVSPELAYVITHMLRGVVERGTGQAARSLGRPVAAKTGSTNDYSNAWFLGYTPRLVSGVWIGYDRPRSLGREETGGRLAGPIWTSYMTRILGDSPREEFPVPERVAIVSVDRDPSNECIRPVPMAFMRGTEPAASCGPRRQMTPSGASGSPSEPGAQPVEPSPESGPPPAAPRAAEPGPSAAAARAAEPGPSAATPRTHEPGPPAAAPRALAPTPPPAAGSSGDRRSAAPGQQAP